MNKNSSKQKSAKAPDFALFKEHLSTALGLKDNLQKNLLGLGASDLYTAGSWLPISSINIAKQVAVFLGVPYADYIDPGLVLNSILPPAFCRANLVVPVKQSDNKIAFILTNPFNLGLIEMLHHKSESQNAPLTLVITAPEIIESFLKMDSGAHPSSASVDITFKKDQDKVGAVAAIDLKAVPEVPDSDESPIITIANNMLQTAVRERASDIHIEPKKDTIIIRTRIDGDMHIMNTLDKKTGVMIINRFKVIGEMDIAEKHKPQDGTVEAVIDNRNFKLRLATTTTPDGESMIIRLLEPHAQPKKLNELGMSQEQTDLMVQLAYRSQGLLLVVGPTGSGKTTTIYSLLSQIDCKTRSLVTIEDPVEYRIPFANHQQVNERAGVTFEALLKSVVRQDPDVIFLGEIRDQYSARMAVDFASTGHLTISSLHTTNATTALFRLERLGISRGIMVEALLCIIAQRLIKKLCTHCRTISPISDKERKMLEPFALDLPPEVANPVGCPRCNGSGYRGREGVYESITLSRDLIDMIRSGSDINQIREFYRDSGGYLISDHALSKMRDFTFSVKDAYEKVLVEEIFSAKISAPRTVTPAPPSISATSALNPSILLVDDDPEIHRLLSTILSNRDYRVTSAQDGIDALMILSTQQFDLILSDVNMPNLDGFKLMEIMKQKNINTPLVFLTSRIDPEDEIKGLELGALDYLKKPVQKDLLLMRIAKLLPKQ